MGRGAIARAPDCLASHAWHLYHVYEATSLNVKKQAVYTLLTCLNNVLEVKYQLK